MTAVSFCAPPEWRLNHIRRDHELDPVETAVEEILALRHEVDDHALALRLLAGIRPDLDALALENIIEVLIDLAREIHDLEGNGHAAWAAAVDEYEHALRTFVAVGVR